MKRKLNVIFCLELEIEIEEPEEIDAEIMEKLDSEDYELEFLGYFEDQKVKANLNFNMQSLEKDALFSNHSELY